MMPVSDLTVVNSGLRTYETYRNSYILRKGSPGKRHRWTLYVLPRSSSNPHPRRLGVGGMTLKQAVKHITLSEWTNHKGLVWTPHTTDGIPSAFEGLDAQETYVAIRTVGGVVGRPQPISAWEWRSSFFRGELREHAVAEYCLV